MKAAAPIPRPWLSPTRRVALGLVVLTLLAYANSFGGLYLFDDSSSIAENPTLRHLSTVFFPMTNGTPVSGRPLVNLTFALNLALGGLSVWGYHAFNLLIHALAVLTLFGLMHRTLLRPVMAPIYRDGALEIAGTVAALWAVHPLLTEAVTYLSQRAESLMGLFYLLTLYSFARSLEESCRVKAWRAAAVGFCLAGMASKEVMISAPLMALLYDRTFGAGSFSAAWRLRRRFYLALAATWLLLAAEMIHVGDRGGAAGVGLTIDSWHYALTQCRAIVIYLVLAFWPHPLVFDYGTPLAPNLTAVLPEAAVVLTLFFLTVLLLWKRPTLGFPGAWFFAILAPTSSVVPLVKQTIAEHRMYLPLAAVLLAVVLAVMALGGRARWCLVLVAPLLVPTLLRNGEYLDGVTIWTTSIARYPGNPRAHINLGDAYVNAGRLQVAAQQFELALQIAPNLPEAHNNLGVVNTALGKTGPARAEFQTALLLSPGWEKPRDNLRRLDDATTPASQIP